MYTKASWSEYPHERRLRLQQAAAREMYEALVEAAAICRGTNAHPRILAALAKARGETA